MFRRSDFKKLEYYEGGGKKNTRIFKVEHMPTKKIYALKEVEAKNLEKLNEYKEEAVQLSKAQNHPNILQFYGYYFYETPHNAYKIGIICEFLDQKNNLEQIYRVRCKKGSYWKEEELLKMYTSLIDALGFLQSIGICHRDIKPANLFIMNNHEVKVIDFGESKENQADEDTNCFSMATIRGTPQYLSPILWKAHVLTPGAKQIEHNMYKSDVFSAGLVLFQLTALKDVTGFNQKTENDGEKLIRDGLASLTKKGYTNKVTDILKRMLIHNEDKRPTFIELGKLVFGDDYYPKSEKGDPVLMQSTKSSSVNKKKDPNTDENKIQMFRTYIEQYKLKFNMNKITYWCEYGGNMIAKYYINKDDNKWKLIGKYKSDFPSHFTMIYVDEDIGHFLIGGTDTNNCFQYRDGQITKKSSMVVDRSFMSCIYFKGTILAIGGYEYNEKIQLPSIEVYDIDNDKWTMNVYEDLKVARSQANSLLYNNNLIYIMGGYNKTYGTLSSIEKLHLSSKTTELLEIKLPIPLRRFATLRIHDNRILILGGITRICKETDNVFYFDTEKKGFGTLQPLPRSGIIDHEVLVDEIGQVHVFFENNYGTSPPVHAIYSYLNY
jgi:serine/threonine protein kinase